MNQVNSYKLLILLGFLFAICSILLFANIFFESVNRALEQDINIISNEKMNLRMSFLHHSSVNNLSSTAEKLNMVHIDEKNSFEINPRQARRIENKEKAFFKNFSEKYTESKKDFLYGF